MNIIDISYTISSRLHGHSMEPKTKFTTICDIKNDCSPKVSEIHLSSHVGTHVDAPAHYLQDGLTIDQLPLDAFVGPCIIIDMQLLSKETTLEPITSAHIKHLKLAPRILFQTRSTNLHQNFPDNFPYLSEECIEYLAAHKTLLIGIDTPSIDPSTSKDLPAHHLCSKYNIRILEGLDLSKVTPGLYTLISLPLKLESLDASPVRAVLIREETADQKRMQNAL